MGKEFPETNLVIKHTCSLVDEPIALSPLSHVFPDQIFLILYRDKFNFTGTNIHMNTFQKLLVYG